MPVTLWPRVAKNMAFSPVPHPASRTEPATRSASCTKAGGGRGICEGALAAYALVKVVLSGMLDIAPPECKSWQTWRGLSAHSASSQLLRPGSTVGRACLVGRIPGEIIKIDSRHV